MTGPAPIGIYSYDAVPISGVLNPPSAAWHPSGNYALVLNAKDKVYRYDPVAHTLTEVASAGSTVVWRAVGFTPDGEKAVLLGNVSSPVEGRIYLWDDATSSLSPMTSETFAGGSYESIAWSPDGTEARLLAQKPNSGTYIAYLWRFDPATGRSDPKAQATSAGCQDLAYATDGFGMTAVPVTCGVNGVSLFYLDFGGNFVSYGGNAGNTSRISARPQGDYALAIGWSGQRVYRFDQGLWSTAFGNPTYPGIFQVQFSTDGRRALILGNYGGNPAVGRVFEFRHDVFTQAGITDVSIPNFALPPYNASSQSALNDVAWRPGCEGGLIVGGANTFTSQQAFVIRFSVDNGIACPN
jgi:WD40 repeat protein